LPIKYTPFTSWEEHRDYVPHGRGKALGHLLHGMGLFASWEEHGSFASCLPHERSMDHLPHVCLMRGAWIMCLMFTSWEKHGIICPMGGAWDHLPHGQSMENTLYKRLVNSPVPLNPLRHTHTSRIMNPSSSISQQGCKWEL